MYVGVNSGQWKRKWTLPYWVMGVRSTSHDPTDRPVPAPARPKLKGLATLRVVLEMLEEEPQPGRAYLGSFKGHLRAYSYMSHSLNS